MKKCLVLVAAWGCSSAAAPTLTIELPDIEIQAGQELSWLCQSWTLNNEEALHVNAVHMQAGLAWHHSNWFFVPESVYAGPDGTWPCAERRFDTLEAGLAGGVLFAQSTQARAETQRFGPGAAVTIPPRSRIVGEVHLLNASDVPLQTAIRFDVELLPREDLAVELRPATFVYIDLDIAPHARSRFSGTCDLASAYGGPLDMRVHYVLPHYHALGEGLSVTAVGGDVDGQVIYETSSAIGEPLGRTLDPPFDLSGAAGMRFGCTFHNRGSEPVGWGIGDQEMCVVLAFVDGSVKWLGGVEQDSALIGRDGDVDEFEGPCRVLLF